MPSRRQETSKTSKARLGLKKKIYPSQNFEEAVRAVKATGLSIREAAKLFEAWIY